MKLLYGLCLKISGAHVMNATSEALRKKVVSAPPWRDLVRNLVGHGLSDAERCESSG